MSDINITVSTDSAITVSEAQNAVINNEFSGSAVDVSLQMDSAMNVTVGSGDMIVIVNDAIIQSGGSLSSNSFFPSGW